MALALSPSGASLIALCRRHRALGPPNCVGHGVSRMMRSYVLGQLKSLPVSLETGHALFDLLVHESALA